ncbi:MAG: hypothetical protein KIT60_14755 [Burkholderiaceae bacterium]|nr:hypothetical protein [Burkholderiaceae bacterium]
MDVAPVDLVIAAAALAAAIVRRPWRALHRAGPPWSWVLAWALLPLLWSIDRQLGVAALPALSGAALLVLMTGWPLAVLACVPMGVIAVLGGPLDAHDALHRAVWLGIVPATLACAIGGAVRRWLPLHVGVYVFAGGFIGSGVAVWLAGTLGAALAAAPATADANVARVMMSLGEAAVTGAVVTLLVAHRPEALASYSDRVYLAR